MALSSASMNLSRVLGPAVAGIIIALVAGGDTGSVFGVGVVFCIIAALYGIAACCIFLLGDVGAPSDVKRGGVFSEVGDGLRYIAGEQRLRALMLAAFATMLFGMPMQFLMPAFNADALGGGPDDLGWLMGAMGVGAITGSLFLARMGETRRKGWLMLGAALCWALATGLFATSRSLGPFWLTSSTLAKSIQRSSRTTRPASNRWSTRSRLSRQQPRQQGFRSIWSARSPTHSVCQR